MSAPGMRPVAVELLALSRRFEAAGQVTDARHLRSLAVRTALKEAQAMLPEGQDMSLSGGEVHHLYVTEDCGECGGRGGVGREWDGSLSEKCEACHGEGCRCETSCECEACQSVWPVLRGGDEAKDARMEARNG